MKKSLFIASLIAAFALAACNNKSDDQPTPETTESTSVESDNMGTAPDADQAVPADSEEIPLVPDDEKNEGSGNK